LVIVNFRKFSFLLGDLDACRAVAINVNAGTSAVPAARAVNPGEELFDFVEMLRPGADGVRALLVRSFVFEQATNYLGGRHALTTQYVAQPHRFAIFADEQPGRAQR